MKTTQLYNASYTQLATVLSALALHTECVVIPASDTKTLRNAQQAYFRTGRFVSELSLCKQYRFIKKVRTATMFKVALL